METGSKESKLARVRSDWVEDAVQLHPEPVWKKRFAVGVTGLSCTLYTVLYWLVSEYRERVADSISELTIFARIMLNILQPFLIVLIIISLSLLVLLFLKIKKPWFRNKSLLAVIGVNCVFAATLLVVSVIKAI